MQKKTNAAIHPKPKTDDIANKIKSVKAEIIANSKDAKWMKAQLDKLLSLKGQLDIAPTELIIPVKEVKDVADFGSVVIKKTIRGYLFQDKASRYSVFVDKNYAGLCSILQTVMDYSKNNETDNPEEKQEREDFTSMVQYIFQAPLFAAIGWSLPVYDKPIDPLPLYNIGTAILKEFNDFCEKYLIKQPLHEETDKDIDENNNFEHTSELVNDILNK